VGHGQGTLLYCIIGSRQAQLSEKVEHMVPPLVTVFKKIQGHLLSKRNHQHERGPSYLSCFMKDFCGPKIVIEHSWLNMTSCTRYKAFSLSLM
jgi:hypothetical protein